MRGVASILSLVALALIAAPALARPVLMISIDGLRPGDVTDADARGLKIPTLRALAAEGAYASGVRGVLPTLTYPSHTTLITGVWPARHGIANNLTFDPQGRNQGGWYWYAEDIKVPTLWDAAHAAGLKVVNVHWPVSVGARAIDLNLPQLWRTGQPDDRKLNRALATPGLTERLEAALGPYADGIDETVEGDELRERFAQKLMVEEKPGFATVYFTGLDHIQHLFGPDTPEAHAALERIDAAAGALIAAARKAEPELIVVIVSDHGFAPVGHDVNLTGAFAEAGLLALDPKSHQVASWEAIPWLAGGSAAIVLARPVDATLRARVEALLTKLSADSALGIAGWVGADQIAALGGAPAASYFVNFQIGHEAGRNAAAALVSPSPVKGTHGYFPAAREMRSTFIIAGPGVPAHGDLGEIDMRDIAPTIAHLLGAPLPTADRPALF